MITYCVILAKVYFYERNKFSKSIVIVLIRKLNVKRGKEVNHKENKEL